MHNAAPLKRHNRQIKMNRLNQAAIVVLAALFSTAVSAANMVDLKTQNIDILKPLSRTLMTRSGTPSTSIHETGRFTDLKKTEHVRFQQYFRGYPIQNAHGVVHIADAPRLTRALPGLVAAAGKKTMNGTIYQNLEADLSKASSVVFTEQQAGRAQQFALQTFSNKNAKMKISNASSKLQIFMDKNHQAHWVFYVTFNGEPLSDGIIPTRPVYILDAETFKIYKQWDEIKTSAQREIVAGGGMGGNKKAMLSYDDISLPAFKITRDADGICYLQNDEMKVADLSTKEVMHFPCAATDPKHNNLYWSADFDSVNGGYSPANDAMFGGQIVKRLYREWYGVPALVNEDGSEMVLELFVHKRKFDDASWNGHVMTFGDGLMMYPLTDLATTAHEVSHGFTDQHSNLEYDEQSGGMNEAFSDMAGQTAIYLVYGKNTWDIGSEFTKLDGEAWRYLDQPSKDCYGKEPGSGCSIDSADQYYLGLDVHYSSGVYNRAFYEMSNAPGWNPRKAFQVMLQANASYWTPDTNFVDGAACVVKAAQDFNYDVDVVKRAFSKVGINVTEDCTSH
jgi:pseudolysin